MMQKEHSTQNPSAVHNALIFFAGVLSTITIVVLIFTLTPDDNIATIPNVYSSSTECEIITGEACFLRDCVPGICPSNFEKGWMPQSIVAQLVPETLIEGSIPETKNVSTTEEARTVPEALSTEITCSTSDVCGDGMCVKGVCHRSCATSEDCASLYEEGECTESNYCSLPMIAEQ